MLHVSAAAAEPNLQEIIMIPIHTHQDDHLFYATAEGAECTSRDGQIENPARRFLETREIEIRRIELPPLANEGARTRVTSPNENDEVVSGTTTTCWRCNEER